MRKSAAAYTSSGRLDPLGAELTEALRRHVGVVRDDPHPEPQRAPRDLLPDPAEAEHAERLAGELDAAVGAPLPAALLERGVRLRDVPRERDEQANRVLGGGDNRGLRRVRHDDPAPRRCVDVDVVDTHAGAPDDLQPLGALDQVGGQLGRRADDDRVVAADDLLERALGIDVHVEARAEKVDSRIRDLFPDEDAWAHVREGSVLNASRAAVTATPRSTSAPRSARTSSTAADLRRDVEDVEPADVAEAEDLPLQLALAVGDRDPEAVADAADDVAGVDAGRRANRRHDGAPILVRREQLEPERLHARPRRPAEPDVAVERSLQTLLEQEVERDVEPGHERDGQRDRRVERLLGLARPLPVEVEARRRSGSGQRGLGDGCKAEAGRRHECLLRAGDDDVEAPRIRLAGDGAEARDRVDDDERSRLLRDSREGTHVGDDSRGGLGLHDPDRFRLLLAQPRAKVVGIRRLAPGVAEHVDVRAERGRHRDPALAEAAGRDHEMALARRDEVRHGRLERAGARGSEEEHVVLRPADLAQPGEHALVDREELRTAVVDHGRTDRGEHLGRHGRRPGREQVPLRRHVPSLAI